MNSAFKFFVVLLAAAPAGAADIFLALRETGGSQDVPGAPSVTYADTRARFGGVGGFEGFVLRVEAEGRLSHFRPRGGVGGSPFRTARPPTAWDGDWEKSGAGWSESLRVERGDVVFSRGGFEFQLGRQPVGLGTSHYLSVLDVLAPLAPGDLDAEYRPGVDAVRVRRSVGDTAEAEILGVAGGRLDEGAWLGRLRFSPGPVDLEPVAGRFRDRGMIGFGWDSDLGGWGGWGEAAAVERRPGDFRGPEGWALSGIVGIERGLRRFGRLGGGVSWNGRGAWSAAERLRAGLDRSHQEGWVHLAGAAHGLITWQKQLHPLWTADVAGLLSGADGSTLWQPRLAFSVANDADVVFFAWAGTGSTDGLGSEFGGVRGVGVHARWSR